MSVIELTNVSKQFRSDLLLRPVRALDGLTLSINKGEVFGFLGPNGAGKSTTIKILLNLIFPDSGTARILDRPVSDTSVRRTVGYLPESPYFYDHLSAEELLRFGGQVSGMEYGRIRERIDLLLDRVDLQSARTRPLRTYSKGMVQRAGLALALVHDPEVVILDEPMSGLDPIGRKMVGDLIMELHEQGKTVFFSSHILTDIERFCDRAGIIIDGHLKLVDSIANLLKSAATLEQVFMREVEKAGGGGAA